MGKKMKTSETRASFINQKLTKLPPLSKYLSQLHCDDNRLTSLPKFLFLKVLYCRGNYITGIPYILDLFLSLSTVDNPFFFKYYRKNNMSHMSNPNYRIAWKNYRILATLQKRAKHAPERHRGLWVHSVDFQRKKSNVLSNYFCRDISRECSKY